MTNAYQTLMDYLQYPFVIYAIIVGVFIALCASLLGVVLVLRRFSYIGDGLSHVAFGAMAVASVLNVTNDMPLVLAITTVAAVFLLSTGPNSKIKGDAAIAMLSVSTMAIGYLLMNMFPTSSNISGDVCTTLFGSTSILTLTTFEVRMCIVLSTLVIALFVLFYNKIFAITFDENFARAVGTKTKIYNIGIAFAIAIIIVLSLNLVGSLLITALVIFPALSAMRVFNSFKSVTICAGIISVICALAGLLISILASTPVGSTIVAANIVAFLFFYALGMLKGGR